ncbi:MAG: D-amino acid aminotransferase [Betaproteobacteria bacterium]|nr:D-amino acid aminotransferase [Betaproteobacteria bacterium]
MNLLPSTPCYLDGAFTPLCDAKVSVMDRGFIFGDGLYEVVPAYSGVPFRFAQHMDRLERSLAEMRMSNPLRREQWHALALQLLAHGAQAAGAAVHELDQLVYIQITRGVAMRDHAMPAGIAPTVFAMANPMQQPTAEQRARGVACVSADDFRWTKAHIKSTSLLGSVFARQISVDAAAAETIMFRDGFLSEAAASNVWAVKDSKVIGTPKDNLVLAGIRYGLIEEMCHSLGLGFELRKVSRAEVFGADELLLSSATKEVLAVTTLDGQPIGSAAQRGLPGPVYAQLHAAYQRAKSAA